MEMEEVIISTGAFPRSLFVNAHYMEHDVTAVQLRFDNLEIEVFVFVQ